MRLIITSKEKSYSEIVDMSEEKARFEECQLNGANPHLENLSFEEYSRPVKDKLSNIDKYNGCHFVFGYLECLFQSYDSPMWITNDCEFELTHENP